MHLGCCRGHGGGKHVEAAYDVQLSASLQKQVEATQALMLT